MLTSIILTGIYSLTQVMIQGRQLGTSEIEKDFGVLVDKLKFSDLVEGQVRKANGIFGLMWWSCKFLNKESNTLHRATLGVWQCC